MTPGAAARAREVDVLQRVGHAPVGRLAVVVVDRSVPGVEGHVLEQRVAPHAPQKQNGDLQKRHSAMALEHDDLSRQKDFYDFHTSYSKCMLYMCAINACLLALDLLRLPHGLPGVRIRPPCWGSGHVWFLRRALGAH